MKFKILRESLIYVVQMLESIMQSKENVSSKLENLYLDPPKMMTNIINKFHKISFNL